MITVTCSQVSDRRLDASGFARLGLGFDAGAAAFLIGVTEASGAFEGSIKRTTR